MSSQTTNEANNSIQYTCLKNARNVICVDRAHYATELTKMWKNNNMLSSCGKLYDLDMIRKHEIHFNAELAVLEDFDFVLSYLKYCAEVISIAEIVYCQCIIAGRKGHLHRGKSDYTGDINYVLEKTKRFVQEEKIKDGAAWLKKVSWSYGAALENLWLLPTKGLRGKIEKCRKIKRVLKSEQIQLYLEAYCKNHSKLRAWLTKHGHAGLIFLLNKISDFIY